MSTSSSLNVAVIGAGITGITTAYNLVRRGCDVTVFDQHPYPAMETSFANGGQLSASNAAVWNNWGTVLKGLRWLLTPSAPLLIGLRPTWHKVSWLAEFLAAIPRYEENTVSTVRLAIEARQHLLAMAAEEGVEFDCEMRGILHVFEDEAELEAAAEVTRLLARGGLERRRVGPDEIAHLEPALKGRYAGGFYTPSDFTGDIHKFTVGLAAACGRRGVTMRMGRRIVGIARERTGLIVHDRSAEEAADDAENRADATRFDRVVVCAGVTSRQIAGTLGDRLNIYPVKGYSITVHLSDQADQAAAPWTSLLDESAKIVTSRLGPKRFRVAGTAELNGDNKDIRQERIAPLVRWCRHHFPTMSTRQVTPWAGLRPMMPDMLPRVRPGRDPRVLYNTGHGHLGWTLSAATAEAVAALVTARPNST